MRTKNRRESLCAINNYSDKFIMRKKYAVAAHCYAAIHDVSCHTI